jgi:hypothetical protein
MKPKNDKKRCVNDDSSKLENENKKQKKDQNGLNVAPTLDVNTKEICKVEEDDFGFVILSNNEKQFDQYVNNILNMDNMNKFYKQCGSHLCFFMGDLFYSFSGYGDGNRGYTRSFQGDYNGKYYSVANTYDWKGVWNVEPNGLDDLSTFRYFINNNKLNIPWTMLQLACACGNLKFVETLLRKGCDPMLNDISGRNCMETMVMLRRDGKFNPCWKPISELIEKYNMDKRKMYCNVLTKNKVGDVGFRFK